MPTTITLSGPELATILAALRYWQKEYNNTAADASSPFHHIAANEGEFPPLSTRQVDALCERINFADPTDPTKHNTTSKLYTLVAACQRVSEIAPKPDCPMVEDMPANRQPDTYEGLEALAYDNGLFHAAEIARNALRSIGIEPAQGTTEWYHEEKAA